MKALTPQMAACLAALAKHEVLVYCIKAQHRKSLEWRTLNGEVILGLQRKAMGALVNRNLVWWRSNSRGEAEFRFLDAGRRMARAMTLAAAEADVALAAMGVR